MSVFRELGLLFFVTLVVFYSFITPMFYLFHCRKQMLRWSLCMIILLYFNQCLYAQEHLYLPKDVRQLNYNRLNETLKDYEEAMAKGDSMEVAEMCYRLGKRYLGLGDYSKGQKFLTRSLKIREPLGPSIDIGKVYSFAADYLSQVGKYAEARHYIRKALQNYQEVNYQRGIQGATGMLAGYYEFEYEKTKNKKFLDSALFYIKFSEQKALVIKNKKDLGDVYYAYGSILSKINIKSGIRRIKKACEMFDQQKYSNRIIDGNLKLTQLYLLIDSVTQAKKYLDKACFVRDTSHVGTYGQQAVMVSCRALFFEKTGKWKKALEEYKILHQMEANILKQDREGAVSRVEIEYETQKKEALVISQQKQLLLRNENLLTQKKLTALATAGGLIFAITGLVCFRFYKKYKQLSIRNAALVSEQNHRVKNNLQGITNLLSLQTSRLKDMEAKNAMEEALLRVEAMALVHQRLYDGNRLIEIDLSQFIPELVNGILRSFSNQEVEPEYSLTSIWIHVDQAVSLGLIINEVITNSCKYAFPTQSAPALSISCIEESAFIELTIVDNGPGFESNLRRKTFGLQLIQSLTENLQGKSIYRDSGNTFYLTFQKQSSKKSTLI